MRTGSWTGPPREERAPRVGNSLTVFGVRAYHGRGRLSKLGRGRVSNLGRGAADWKEALEHPQAQCERSHLPGCHLLSTSSSLSLSSLELLDTTNCEP